MAIKLSEDLVSAVVTYIEANLAAKLAALEAEYGDGVSLEMTVATYRAPRSLRYIRSYPILFVIVSEASVIPHSTAGGPGAVVEERPTVHVGIAVLERDDDILQARLYRYGRALVELLDESEGQLGGWSLLTPDEWLVDYLGRGVSGGFIPAEETALYGEVAVTVRGRRLEVH